MRGARGAARLPRERDTTEAERRQGPEAGGSPERPQKPPPRKRQRLGMNVGTEPEAGGGGALVPPPPQRRPQVPEHLPCCTRGGSKKSSVTGVCTATQCEGERESERSTAAAAAAATATAVDDSGTLSPPISGSEVVRLMLQTLEALGLRQSAAALEAESGVALEAPHVVAFRTAVLEGQWESVERALDEEENTLELSSRLDLRKAQYLVARQRYLELVEEGHSSAALALLRTVLGPICTELSATPTALVPSGAEASHPSSSSSSASHSHSHSSSHSLSPDDSVSSSADVARQRRIAMQLRPKSEPLHYGRALRQLSSLFSCPSPEALRKEAKWPGIAGGSREELLYHLQDYVPAGVMVPEHRLSTLLRQAVLQQVRNCPLHNAVMTSISLLEDHCCVSSKLPKEPRAILNEHTDEVWAIEFSHCGSKLASASTDGCVIVWDVSVDGLGSMLQRFQPNGEICVISFMEWSPNDEHMLLCSRGEVIVWDVLCASEVRRFSMETLGGTMHTVAWGEDGESFYCGGSEKFVKKVSLATGDTIAIWPTPSVVDMAMSRDRSRLVVACQDKLLVILDLETGTMDSFKDAVSITALTLSHDHHLAALHMTNQEIHVWDLRSKMMTQKFSHTPDVTPLYYVIRPSFGGANEALLLCGSEGGDIHVWHREKGEMIEVIKGHTKMVNSVCWNPLQPHMFASASDDGTIRIWTTEGL